MFTLPLGLNAQLSIISIGAAHDADPLDLLDWESFDLLSGIANQAEATNATAIGEGDVASIGVQLPSRLLVLDAPVIMLKLGITLLARFLVPTILIEAGDSSPGTVGTGLTGLRIETGGKRVVFGKDGAIALQIVLVDPAPVHPKTETLVTNELHDANRFMQFIRNKCLRLWMDG